MRSVLFWWRRLIPAQLILPATTPRSLQRLCRLSQSTSAPILRPTNSVASSGTMKFDDDGKLFSRRTHLTDDIVAPNQARSLM